MKIAISSGHGKYIRGASGDPVPPQLDEVDEARRVVEATADKLRSSGIECVTFHDNTSHDQSTNLATITNWHNAQGNHELDVSIHFNAFDGSAHGCEVLYLTQQTLAGVVSAAISEAGHFTNRGAKYRSDLYVINNTIAPCILVEVCFCDHAGDSNNYNQFFDDIAEAIAESVSGREVPDEPGDRPPEPEEPPPDEENRVDIVGRTEGDVTVIINGTRISGTSRCRNVVRMRIGLTRDVTCSINGEEFHNTEFWRVTPDEPPPPLQVLSERDIEAICDIARGSAIADYTWKDRGKAPVGYTQGMALAFAQTYRKLLAGHPAAVDMAKARTSSDKDALHIYWEEFEALGMSNERAGIDTLRHLYALMLGHGMRESSGRHCEGRDLSADNVQSNTAEAGLFQTSYNAHSASDPEFDDLMDEYSDSANKAICYLSQFDDGVSCSSDEWGCYGSGNGYQFQKLCKECPPFAVETCGLTLRNLANHYGPIIRKETELKQAAEDLFREVQDYIENEPAA
jgi:hypothetical protein